LIQRGRDQTHARNIDKPLIAGGEMKKNLVLMMTGMLFILQLACGTAFAADEVVTVCVDTEYPPWTWVEKGEVKGFDWELWQFIAKDNGFTIKPSFVPWPQSLIAVEKGQADVQAGGVSFTCERAEKLSFAKPYWRHSFFALVRADSDLNGVTALSMGAKVGSLMGTSLMWLENNLKAKGVDVTLQAYDSTDLGMKDLENGRIDTMFVDGPTAKSFIEKGRNVKAVGQGYGYDFTAYSVPKGDPKQLIPKIEESIKKAYESGKWAELVAKYLPGSPVVSVPMDVDYDKDVCTK
jgi:polar amino acid transport system substrate-binding protein